MKNVQITYFLLLIVCMISCTKELPFPDIDNEPQLVLNSFFSPEELILHLSESCHILDEACEDKFIADAQVQLKDESGNVLVDFEHTIDGIYTASSSFIDHSKIYSVEVISANDELANITASSSVPSALTSSYLSKEEGVVDGYGCWSFEIEIEDNPDEENFYVIEGSFDLLDGEHDDRSDEGNGYIIPHFGHLSDDPNCENEEIYFGLDFDSYPLRAVYLPDENFNGETYRTRVGIRDRDLYFSPAQEIRLNLYVKSVSKEMYDYLKTLELSRLTQDNVFAEPQIISSNVENGLGIFAGYTQQYFTDDLPQSAYRHPTEVTLVNDGCTGPCSVQFNTNGGELMDYLWDFGDGQSSTEPNPEHTYSSPGEYFVSLNASFGDGDSSGFTFNIFIN